MCPCVCDTTGVSVQGYVSAGLCEYAMVVVYVCTTLYIHGIVCASCVSVGLCYVVHGGCAVCHQDSVLTCLVVWQGTCAREPLLLCVCTVPPVVGLCVYLSLCLTCVFVGLCVPYTLQCCVSL